MIMMAPRIQNLLNGHSHDSRGAIFIVGGGLCPVPGARLPSKPYQENLIPVFEEELRTNPAIDRVVMSGHWQSFFSKFTNWCISDASMGGKTGRTQAMESFGEMIDRLFQSGKQVTVVLALPIATPLDPTHMYARRFSGSREVHVTPLTVDEFRQMSQRSHIDELAAVAKANGADVIDPVPFLSRDGICISTDDDGPIRHDTVHLRANYVRDHVTYLDATVADGASTFGNTCVPIKKPVEAPSATTQPSE
jgi:hypothetical protein